MNFLEKIKAKAAYAAFTRVIRNRANYKFYKKTMLDLSKNGTLEQYGLRLADEPKANKLIKFFALANKYRCQAYYALNLEPEILMMGSEAIDLEKSRVYESLLIKKAMYEEAGLGELIEAKTERIKTEDYYAYLIQIQYRPISTKADITYVIVWMTVCVIALSFIAWLGFQYEIIGSWLSRVVTSK